MSDFPSIRELLPGRAGIGSAAELEEWYRPVPDRHLRVNFVASLDGAVAVEGRSGPLGGPADRAAFMAQRAVADVVLVGAGTVRAEDYGPVRLAQEVQKRRLDRGQAPRPPLAVVTARGALDASSRVFGTDAEVVVFTTARAARLRPDLAEVAEVVPSGDSAVDLSLVVAELHRRGLGRILCEGGTELMRSLLLGHLVQELCLTISPFLAGPQSHHLSAGVPPTPPDPFRLAGLLEGDGMLLGRYAHQP